MIYQLVLIDEETGQPQKVETVKKVLDLSSPLQKKLYLDTINSQSIKEDLMEIETGEPEEVVLRIRKKTDRTPTDKTPTTQVYEPEPEKKAPVKKKIKKKKKT